MPLSSYRGHVLVDDQATWANLASADTEQVVSVPRPSWGGDPEQAKAVILVHNPSSVTALSGTYRLTFEDSQGTERKADLATFAVATNETKAIVVDVGFTELGAEVALSNDSLLGASDGFSAEVQVQQL